MGIISLFAVLILTVTAVPDQTQSSALDIMEVAEVNLDNDCTINCTLDFDDAQRLHSSLDLVTLPDSYDTILVRALEDAELIDISNVKVNRHLGDETSPVSEINLSKTLSVITHNGIIRDLSAENLSYTFQISETDNILFGSILIEYVINGKSHFEKERYAIPSGIPKNGLIEITTTPKTIEKLAGSQTTGNVEIILRVHELFVRNDGGLYSLLSPTDIHTFNVALDVNQIIYTNESGTSVIIYPSDDKLVIQSVGAMSYGAASCHSSTRGNCNSFIIASWVAYPTADVGAIQIFDSLGNKVFSRDSYVGSTTLKTVKSGNGNKMLLDVLLNPVLVDIDIQRNSEYLIKVGSPQNYEFTIKTPKSQHNYHYTCDGLADICNFP